MHLGLAILRCAPSGGLDRLILGRELQTDAVDAMPLIRRGGIPLTLENVT